ncbi:MAG: putative DNA binding domain-containing protein [Lachnospiraceae bacterium]|nr:putative DNA binding domain-containing protein [Lachnospiraceae bacterium]
MREDEYTEYKKTTGELNEAMVSISSILNKHRQGKVYFGLKNDGTPVRFTITDSTLRDVSRKIFESIRPQIIPTVTTDMIDGNEVIVVEFQGDDVPYSAFGKYYIRIADEDRELTPAELRKIMIGQEYAENWENKTSEETISDVDDKTLESFYRNAVQCGRMPDYGYNKEGILRSLGVLNGDSLTNAGRVLFSNKHPIVLKMAVFATEHKETFLDIDREEGNIFQLIDTAVGYIIKNIRWRVEMEGDGIHRKEIPEIPVDAMREAVINSFAHARYDLPVQHEIDIFSNRISIVNPGSFANEFEPIDFVSRDIHSFLRNETIARVLYLCKDVETFGSGIRKIYSLCDTAGVEIKYENADTDFKIEFSRIDRNKSPLFGQANGRINDHISDLEQAVLSCLRDDPGMTNAELIVKTGKSQRTITRVLASLKGKGLITRIGSNKTGYWQVK